jgi:hypothetical protein
VKHLPVVLEAPHPARVSGTVVKVSPANQFSH